VPHPNDRRATNLELTEEGTAVYPKLREAAVDVLNRLLRGFSKNEVQQLEGFLQRILDNA
jgi:DNA-binding MarR family transcriptional regulator